MKRLMQLALAAVMAITAVASHANAGITSPWPWYWGQDGSNPGTMVLSTTAWTPVKSLQVVPQGNQFCSVCGGCCSLLNVTVGFKHARQADVAIIVTVNGNVVNMGSPTTGPDGSVQYSVVVEGTVSNPTISLYMLAAGSSITFTQSSFPSEYIIFHASNGY